MLELDFQILIFLDPCVHAGIDSNQSSQHPMPSHPSRIIGSCSGFESNLNCLEGLDVDAQGEFWNQIPQRRVREHSNDILKSYFEQHSVIA